MSNLKISVLLILSLIYTLSFAKAGDDEKITKKDLEEVIAKVLKKEVTHDEWKEAAAQAATVGFVTYNGYKFFKGQTPPLYQAFKQGMKGGEKFYRIIYGQNDIERASKKVKEALDKIDKLDPPKTLWEKLNRMGKKSYAKRIIPQVPRMMRLGHKFGTGALAAYLVYKLPALLTYPAYDYCFDVAKK